MSSERTPYRSKTLATWLSIFGGAFGLHRFYLRGLGNVPAWLARSGQRDNMVAFLKVLKERAAKAR